MVLRPNIVIGIHIVIRVQISTCIPKQTFWNCLYLQICKTTIDAFYTEPNKLAGSLKQQVCKRLKLKYS